MTIRAKFLCSQETRHANTEARTFKFQATYDANLPEDQRFAKATPSGSMEIYVDNPAAKFEVGTYYYLDFVKVDA